MKINDATSNLDIYKKQSFGAKIVDQNSILNANVKVGKKGPPGIDV